MYLVCILRKFALINIAYFFEDIVRRKTSATYATADGHERWLNTFILMMMMLTLINEMDNVISKR
jgi:hypothetical protein